MHGHDECMQYTRGHCELNENMNAYFRPNRLHNTASIL